MVIIIKRIHQNVFARRMFFCLTTVLIVSGFFHVQFLLAASAGDVVISEIQIADDTTNDDFIELYNPTSDDIDLAANNYRIERATFSGGNPGILMRFGNEADGTYPGGLIIPSYGYYLIVRDDAKQELLDIADAIGTRSEFTLTNDNVIYLGNATISGPDDEDIIDFVGYGNAPDYEGTGTAPAPATGQSIERKSSLTHNELEGNGWDTDDNSADFIDRTTPESQNSSSATERKASKTVCNNYLLCDYTTIQLAIDAASSDDTINVGAGTYDEQLTINTTLTLSGAGTSTVVLQPNSSLSAGEYDVQIYATSTVIQNFTFDFDGTSGTREGHGSSTGIAVGENGDGPASVPSVQILNNTIYPAKNGIGIISGKNVDISGLTISGNTIYADIDGNDKGAGIYISPYPASSSPVTISSNQIFGHLDYGIGIEAGNVTVSGNTIQNTVGTAVQYGIGYIDQEGASFNNVTISGNSIQSMPKAVLAGVDSATYAGFSGTPTYNGSIQTNSFSGNNVGIYLDYGVHSGFTISNNSVISNSTYALQNTQNSTITAESNWWGTASSTVLAGLMQGNIDYDPWYLASDKNMSSSILTNDGYGLNATTSNAQLTSETSGQADLPTSVVNIILSDSTVLDVSNSTTTVSGNTISVDSGSVSANQTIGGQSVTAQKKIKLRSGTSGQNITLSNTDFAGASVVIPDATTIFAPDGWAGAITPPKATSTAGTAPSGFSIGDTIIEVGSSDSVLLFDKPVKITLTGVTGDVGYKPAGSDTWQQITTVCDDASNPTNITFPNECYITVGSDTVIHTYHFTTFGSLNSVSTESSTPTATFEGSIPIWWLNEVSRQKKEKQEAELEIEIPKAITAPEVLGVKIENPRIIQLNQILSDATAMVGGQVKSVLVNTGISRDLVMEKQVRSTHVTSLIKALAGLASDDINALTNFVTYGTLATQRLSQDERAGTVNSYKSAFGKLPTTEAEWSDAIKIANGRWPSETNETAENKAAAAFKKIYLRESDRTNLNDDAAVTVMAYGLRPSDRNLDSERAGIRIFHDIFGYTPSSATDWDAVRAIAYSGATR